MHSDHVYEAPRCAARCSVNSKQFNSVVFLKSFIVIYCILVISSWLTAGCCSGVVTPKSSTSPPLFWAQILLLLSRQQRKVLTPLPYCSFLYIWCPPPPILDYCNTLCACFDVITMCNLYSVWNLMEQWPDRQESATDKCVKCILVLDPSYKHPFFIGICENTRLSSFFFFSPIKHTDFKNILSSQYFLQHVK